MGIILIFKQRTRKSKNSLYEIIHAFYTSSKVKIIAIKYILVKKHKRDANLQNISTFDNQLSARYNGYRST